MVFQSELPPKTREVWKQHPSEVFQKRHSYHIRWTKSMLECFLSQTELLTGQIHNGQAFTISLGNKTFKTTKHNFR